MNKKENDGPSSDLPGDAPSGRSDGTGLCCACPASGTVSTNGVGNYCVSPYSATTTRTNKCDIAMTRTTTSGRVTFTKKCKLAYANGASAGAHATLVTNRIAAAMSNWTTGAAPYRIEVKQPGCGTQKLRIQFASSIVTSDPDLSITVDNTPDATLLSSVSGGTRMTYYLADPDTTWTVTHELGHSFGLCDLYTYNRPSATPAPTAVIKGADQPDHTVTLVASTIPPSAAGQHSFDFVSVMGQANDTTYQDFLFYWCAIETKKLLADNGVNADVRIVPA